MCACTLAQKHTLASYHDLFPDQRLQLEDEMRCWSQEREPWRARFASERARDLALLSFLRHTASPPSEGSEFDACPAWLDSASLAPLVEEGEVEGALARLRAILARWKTVARVRAPIDFPCGFRDEVVLWEETTVSLPSEAAQHSTHSQTDPTRAGEPTFPALRAREARWKTWGKQAGFPGVFDANDIEGAKVCRGRKVMDTRRTN